MPDGSSQRRNLMQKQKAFFLLKEKNIKEEADAWVVRGIATTPRTDRIGDIVESTGAVFERMPKLMLYHDSRLPIGNVIEAKPTKTGIPFEARIPKVAEDGVVKDRIDEAVHSLKYDLISYTSIGFNPLEFEPIEPKDPWGPQHFTKWEWLELSLVTIPANPDAVITGIKAFDDEIRSAWANSAVPGAAPRNQAGAAARSTKGTTMLSIHEQLAALQDSRKTKAARMEELLGLKKEAKFDEPAREEFGTLKTEIEDLNDEIALKEVQSTQVKTAQPVADQRRAPMGFVRKQDPDDKFKGQGYARKLLARAIAHVESRDAGYQVRPSDIAERLWGKTNPQLIAVMKANEVAGGGTGSGEWGAELASVDGRYTGDFIEFLYSKTVFDRLPLREVPSRVTIKGQDGAATGYFIGESKAIKVSKPDFSTVNTTPYKVAALTQFSKELLADSSPAVEMLVRDSLEAALRQIVDSTFLSTANVSAGVSPAGILYNLSIGASNGPDAQSVRTDYRALMANFITLKELDGLYWVTTPTIAVGLSSMVNAFGQPEFPSVNVMGGTFMGYPVITGDNVGSGDFILLKPSEIWKIGDTGITTQVSDVATIESSSAPSGAADTPTAADQAITSMFQTDSVAIKVTRRISWGLRRSAAVAYIGDAAYGAEAS